MELIDLTIPLPGALQRIADDVARDIRGQAGDRPRVGVAYSGGVDSTVLAALTARAIGADRTTLVMAVSASLAKRERR
ncbi:MAG: ATP-binding protein, partial [Propionibacterium sp.]|nr:ATP-binding protein [Propionibacterium sp.]